MLLGRDPDCGFELERAAVLRRSPETGRMSGLAIRVATADLAVPFKSPEALAARVLRLRRMLGYRIRVKQGVSSSRFLMEPGDEGKTWNAIGIGFTRVNDADNALAAFQIAIASAPKDFVYRANRAVAYRVKSEHPPAEEKEPVKWERDNLDRYATNLLDATIQLAGQPDKEKTAQDLLFTVSAAKWRVFLPPEATIGPIDVSKDKFHLGEADYLRWVGALSDWYGKLDRAVPAYRKAIELHHRDSSKMEARVDKFEHDKRR